MEWKLSDSNLVSWFQIDTPFLMAGFLSLISVIVTLLLLPETHPYEKRPLHLRFWQSVIDIKQAVAHKRLNTLFLIGFLFQFAFTMFVSFFGVLLLSDMIYTGLNRRVLCICRSLDCCDTKFSYQICKPNFR